MTKHSDRMRLLIGDDGELLQPFPFDESGLKTDDMEYVIAEPEHVYYHPLETRRSRLRRWWGRIWIPCLLFILSIVCLLSAPFITKLIFGRYM